MTPIINQGVSRPSSRIHEKGEECMVDASETVQVRIDPVEAQQPP
jgi:hypothetical protein